MSQQATNTLYAEITCAHCGKKVSGGIGFRAGEVAGHSYKIGDKIKWAVQDGDADSLKTVGYFECDNLKCGSWSDCYPEIQEALVTIRNGVITGVEPFVHKPGEMAFDIIESKE